MECNGTKSFIAQVRNTHTYNLMHSVNIGDVGKNKGRDGIDSGWIQFTNVRIPRTNMLMKHTKVSRTGEVKEPAVAQLTYGVPIQGHVAMVVDSGNIAKKAVAITVQETKLIGYAIRQYRLMPLSAQAYAFHPAGVETNKLYEKLMDKLESTHPDDASTDADVISSIATVRHSPERRLKGVDHLNNLDTLLIQICAVKTLEEILDFDVIQQVWGVGAAKFFKKPEGMNPEVAYEECSQARLTASKIHASGCVLRRFAQATKSASEGLRPVLNKICLLYGLYSIEQNSWFFLKYRCFTPSQIDFYIPLIDAFNYFDYMINSTLGVYDGNAYEKYFDQAKGQDPICQPHTYLTLIQSLLRSDIKDDGNDDDE
ncbi:fatty-acyl coenzyme A oxidase [Dissophora ornata]|nr:fatty-acyl coenzyme A oxidase [Dissophora ornata]